LPEQVPALRAAARVEPAPDCKDTDVKPDALGSYAFVLHSHIPYVLAHGRWPHGMDWLAEVAAETYVPLLDVLYRLVAEGVSPQITIGITPVLTEQLADETFKSEFIDYLERKIQTAILNQGQFKYEGNMHLLGLAHYWQDFYARILTQFKEAYGQDLVGAFRTLQDDGHIEIITCAATHGYLPLLLTDASVQAQIRQGVQTYVVHYGRQPSGFWLPECAYRPRYAWNPPVEKFKTPKPKLRRGVEEFLAENGLEYFFVDAHLLKGGQAIGVYAERFKGLQELWAQFSKEYVPEIADRTPYQPYLVNSSGEPMAPVAIFSRDEKTGVQVWSGETGYPGDEFYLEFHKKHYPGNLRYWRISWPKDDLGAKQLYQPYQAAERLHTHAAHFVNLIRDTLAEHKARYGAPGFITALFDTELYGHWWFEGPEFLYHVLKALHEHPEIELSTCRDCLHAHPPKTVVSLPEGSWGEGGYHWIWLNEWTAWTWEKIYEAEQTMVELAEKYSDVPRVETILKQAARELLLLESSDWQFSISTFTSRDYAEQRVHFHYMKFMQLADLVRRAADSEEISPDDWNLLGEAEDRDRCFADVKPEWWAGVDARTT
jgi:1,4-alpha-glucan branching enzyme